MADGAARSCFNRENPCQEEDLTPEESDPTKKLKRIRCTEPPSGKDSVSGGSKAVYNSDGSLTTDGNKQIDDILKTMGMDEECTTITKNQVKKDVFNMAASAKSSAFGMIELGVAMQAQNIKTSVDRGTIQQGCSGVAAQFSDITNAYSNLSCKMQKNKSTTNVQSVQNATIEIKGCMGTVAKDTNGKIKKDPLVNDSGSAATLTTLTKDAAIEVSNRLAPKIAGKDYNPTSTIPQPITAYGQVFTWDTVKGRYVSNVEKMAENIRSNLAIMTDKKVQLMDGAYCANFPSAAAATDCNSAVMDYNIKAQESKTDNIQSFNDTLIEISKGCQTIIKNSTLTASSELKVKVQSEIQADQEVDTTTELKAITQAATEAKVKNKLGLDAITPKTKKLINSKINNSYNNASVTSLDNEMNKSVTVRTGNKIELFFAGPVNLDGVTINANSINEIDLKSKLISATKTAETIATELALKARTSTNEDTTVAGVDDLVESLGVMTATEMTAIQAGNNAMVDSVMKGVSSENPLKYLGLMMLIVPVILILLVMFLMGGGKKAAGGGGRGYPPPRGHPGYRMRFGGSVFKWILILTLLGVLVWLGLATAYEWWPFECKLNIKNLWEEPDLCSPAASTPGPAASTTGSAEARDLRREREHGLEFSRASAVEEEPRFGSFEARRIVKNYPKNTQSYNKNVTFNLH